MRCNYTPTKEQEKAINKILAKEQKRIADDLAEQARKLLKEDLAEQRRKIAENALTITMWTLYSCFGFGKKRLERVKAEFNNECKRMLDFYEMGEGEYVKLCKYKLKDELGIDVTVE